MTPPASSDVLVIGYGSLMSAFGLQLHGPLRVRGACRLALANAQRGFGKFSQHGDRFAMVLESLDAAQPIEAQTLAADASVGGGPEALGLRVPPNDLARLAEREGYSSGALQQLRAEAARRACDLATFLWQCLDESGFDVPRFRERIFRLVGYTSPHYLPHPVRLDAQQYGLTFLAPGIEGSGSSRVVPVRVGTQHTALMTLSEAWRRKPNRSQLTYFAACLLGGAHGVYVGDLLAALADDAALHARLRPVVAAEQRQELARFLATTGLDHASYRHAFGPSTQALRRSGLDALLNG